MKNVFTLHRSKCVRIARRRAIRSIHRPVYTETEKLSQQELWCRPVILNLFKVMTPELKNVFFRDTEK